MGLMLDDLEGIMDSAKCEVMSRPCEYSPKLSSQYFDKNEMNNESFRKSFRNLVESVILNNFGLFYEMVPLSNDERSNFQSKQALRVFFLEKIATILWKTINM